MDILRHQQLIAQGKQVVTRLKPLLRWVILGSTLFFLATALRRNWSEVTELRVDATGWTILTIALGITLSAHIWSGFVWSRILQELNQPAQGTWGVLTYLKTNIAKYLPGNVWHFYGRVVAARNAGFSMGAATLSVLLEPLLMAAAALAIALISLNTEHWLIQGLSLGIVLIGIHPRILNLLLKVVGRLKAKKSSSPETDTAVAPPVAGAAAPLQLKRYPLLPLCGELIFVALRGIGFVLTVLALSPVSMAKLPAIFSGFSFAWLLGLIIPGAPGGLGVFEATAIALLDSHLSPAVVLGSMALYRLISTLAEAGGAGLAWLDDRWNL